MQRLPTQPITIRANPEELGGPAHIKHTHRAVAAHQLCTLCVAMLKSVKNSLRNDDLCETHAQHTRTNGQITARSRLYLTRTRPAFVQYRTDLRQTKIAVCSLARANGESNAREWWVPVRVFPGLSV